MLTVLGLCSALLMSVPAPQATAANLDIVVEALGRGDAATASGYFDKTIELVLPGVEDILTQAQARTRLAAFFERHPVSGFTRVHGGTSGGEEGAYVIGTLSSGGDKFRVFVYGRGAATPVVQELRIEAE